MQHVMTYVQWTERGGWEPGIAVTEDWIVNAYIGDDGAVAWANFWPPDTDVAASLNPDVPHVDHRGEQ